MSYEKLHAQLQREYTASLEQAHDLARAQAQHASIREKYAHRIDSLLDILLQLDHPQGGAPDEGVKVSQDMDRVQRLLETRPELAQQLKRILEKGDGDETEEATIQGGAKTFLVLDEDPAKDDKEELLKLLLQKTAN
jgi:hypothetical protein